LPGSFPGEGSPYAWSAVVNSSLVPTLGLRWLLCYEEHDRDLVHLQKAAPKHWFRPGDRIRVEGCPTRFGPIRRTTETRATAGDGSLWRVEISWAGSFDADLVVHLHPPSGEALRSTSAGELGRDRVVLRAASLAGREHIAIDVK